MNVSTSDLRGPSHAVRSLVSPGLLAAALLLASCSEEVPPPQPTTGSVLGTVTLADQPSAPDLSGSLVTAGSALAITNAAGQYRFDGLAPGDLKLRVTRDGYLAQEQLVSVAVGQTATADFALAPPEKPNLSPAISSLSIVPQQLKPKASASLVVVASDPDGDPLSFSYSADHGFSVVPGSSPGTATVTAPDSLDLKGTVTVVVDDGKGGSATGKLEVSTSQNTQPSLSSLTASPSSVIPGGTILLSAVASDAESATLSFAWTAPDGWTLEGQGPQVSLKAPPRYSDAGLVLLVVSDEHGGKANGQVAVSTVPNAKPVVVSLTATPSQVAPNGSIALAVSAYDPHGDPLSFSWAAPEGWALTPDGNKASLVAPDLYGQTASVSVTVDDGFGGLVQADVVVSTSPNRAPVLSSLTASPPTVLKGGSTQLAASASDPDGDSLSYSWSAPDGWTLVPNGSTASLTAPNSPGLTATVSLLVDDGRGASVSGSLVVSTAANGGPVISSVTATPSSVQKGGSSLLQVTAADPDGDPLSFAWSAPDGWTLVADADKATLTAPSTPGLTATVQVLVSDSSGSKASGSVVVSTRQNSPPAVSSIAVAPQSVQKGGEVTLTASASDPDGDSLTFSWQAPDGWTLKGEGPKVTLTAPATPGASGVVLLAVSDSFGGSTSASAVVSTRQNASPVISSLTAKPATVQKGGTISLSALASDADGDSLTYSWKAPDGWTLSGEGPDVSLAAPSSPGLSGSVQLSVSDSFGGSASSSVVVATAANRAPQVTSITATPPTVGKGKTTQVAVTAADPDGDALTYEWKAPEGWTITGSGPSVSVKAPNLPGTSGTIEVTVSDGAGGTAQSAIVVATSPNQAPTFASFSASPNPTTRAGTMTATTSVTDADGDALSYAWSVADSAWTVTPNGAQATVKAPNAYSASTTLKVVASDGFGGSTSATLLVATVANQPPRIQTMTTEPMPVLPGQPTAVQVSATDPDGDALSYSWAISDTTWTLTPSGTTATAASPFANDQKATVTVTVSDGFGGTVQGSALITTGSCAGSTMNCDGQKTNGCEANLDFDEQNCGTCGEACAANTFCGPGGKCYASPGNFRIDSLTANSCLSIEHNSYTGDDRGGIAVSNANVFYTGDNVTGRFALGSLAASSLASRYDALFTDLATRRVYTLANSSGPIPQGGGQVTRLVEIDGETGALTTTEIALDQPVTASNGDTGIFSGWNRLVLLTGGKAYDIVVPSGHVEARANVPTPPHANCENWAYWGTAEYYGGELYLNYVQNGSTIARLQVSNNAVTTLASFSNLSDMCSFVVSTGDNRWYWHHEGTSQFRSGDEAIGYCAATFSNP